MVLAYFFKRLLRRNVYFFKRLCIAKVVFSGLLFKFICKKDYLTVRLGSL